MHNEARYFLLKDKLNKGLICMYCDGEYWEYDSSKNDFVKSELFYQYKLDYGAFTDLYEVLPESEVDSMIEKYKHDWGLQESIAEGYVCLENVASKNRSRRLLAECKYIEYKPLVWLLPLIAKRKCSGLTVEYFLGYGFNLKVSRMIVDVIRGYDEKTFKNCFGGDYKLYTLLKNWAILLKDNSMIKDLENHRLNSNSEASKREIKEMMYDIETRQMLKHIEKGE